MTPFPLDEAALGRHQSHRVLWNQVVLVGGWPGLSSTTLCNAETVFFQDEVRKPPFVYHWHYPSVSLRVKSDYISTLVFLCSAED